MNVSKDILYKLLQKIPISTQVKYIPHEDGDGEQNRTIFFKTNYPFTKFLSNCITVFVSFSTVQKFNSARCPTSGNVDSSF